MVGNKHIFRSRIQQCRHRCCIYNVSFYGRFGRKLVVVAAVGYLDAPCCDHLGKALEAVGNYDRCGNYRCAVRRKSLTLF